MSPAQVFGVVAFLLPTASLAQEEPGEPLVPIRMEIVLTDGDGERVVHTLQLTANLNTSTSLRQGREIAVPGTSSDAEYQYRNVGTNIQCRARTKADGFLVMLSLEQSSLAESSGALPSFHTFHLMNELLLSDGETAEIGSASSETWRVSVKLDVLE